MTDQIQGLARDNVLASAGGGGPVTTSDCTIRVLPPAGRWSLRVDPNYARQAPVLAGFTINQPINSITGSEYLSLRLGPDEWLLVSEKLNETASQEISGSFGSQFHSLVDISHRNVAIEIEGNAARRLLNTNCLRDLDEKAFPAGSASRTLFGKAEIILARPTSPSRFRLECWRSFARYTSALINDAAKLQGLRLSQV